MDELRSLFTDKFDIIDKKIIYNNKIIENKYIEIEYTTYNLLQILFYIKHEELPFHQYLQLAEENNIHPVDAKLINFISIQLFPKEKCHKNKFELCYDFKFLLNYNIQKNYVILVPAAISSKLNLYNCLNGLSVGSLQLPIFDKNSLLKKEKKLKKHIETCTAEFTLKSEYHTNDQHNIVAIFLDGSNWQKKELLTDNLGSNLFDQNIISYAIDLKCPIFCIHNTDESQITQEKNQINIKIHSDRIDSKNLQKIWSLIQKYINSFN